jgi:hypothetical protein
MGYTISVMIVSFEASANVDTTLFGYFSLKYDQDFFQDIKENLIDIKKDDLLSFSISEDDIKLLFGEYHTIRRFIKIADVELQKFTDVFSLEFDSVSLKKFKSVKLNIDKDYFYFTGIYESARHKTIEFQSLNFDTRFIDSLHKTYNKKLCVVS